MNLGSSRLAIVTVVLISASFTGTPFAQAASPVIAVTNPNAVLPLTTVQFSDTMPAGIDLITQTGGTCSTLATALAAAACNQLRA